MRVLLVSFVVAVVTASNERAQFHSWAETFNKTYASSSAMDRAYTNFVANLAVIERMNANPDDTAHYGLGPFTDLSAEEFRQFYLTTIDMPELESMDATPASPAKSQHFGESIPPEFDWRNTPGKVTGVYNQGQCGSCWAFSATEAIESAWAITRNQLPNLSPQQMVDCDKQSHGCGGGSPVTAFQTIIQAGGQDSIQAYPYTGRNGMCRPNPGGYVAKIRSWKWATQNRNEQDMAGVLVASGPLSVCVDAVTWQHYTGGVINGCTGTQTDHCVVVTGYSTSGQYWIVRNSWSAQWGIGGYCHVAAFRNMCLIASYPSVPIV